MLLDWSGICKLCILLENEMLLIFDFKQKTFLVILNLTKFLINKSSLAWQFVSTSYFQIYVNK